jgi:hypothetical protein
MAPLTAFGLFAVTAMLVCYAFEPRSHWVTLAFAGACVLGSVYGFLQGAWPFGVVEAHDVRIVVFDDGTLANRDKYYGLIEANATYNPTRLRFEDYSYRRDRDQGVARGVADARRNLFLREEPTRLASGARE